MEAMSKIDLAPPDLVFMDIQLPGINGIELTRMIKSRNPEAIIIILSNHDVTEYREAAYRNGADYYVSKDSPVGDLFFLVERIIGNQVGREDGKNQICSNVSDFK